MPARRATRTPEPPAFLNVDLEIESSVKLDALAAEWGERVFVVYSGPGRLEPGSALRSRRHLLTLETGRQYKDPDRAIHAFCALVEELSPASCCLWDAAHKRFDLGYDLRPMEQWTHCVLRPDTLTRLTALGAALAVSVYCRERIDQATSRAAALSASTTVSPKPKRQSSGSPRPPSA